ncbi:unnamed protein product [Sphenostylis stenocarpa]|uniref:Uncharacterized protein n=1 Tax=Sphenostylis stenocarpa TaxID=92480 RepID=A0AA86SJM4_9FABA|nr:unnamed protein product [Sphenostylis stenocarpa]
MREVGKMITFKGTRVTNFFDNFVQQAQKYDDLSSSSSTMISFELSNGRLYSPLVPTDLDDDQYVEFQLDDFTAIPSNAKEQQKMFMETVIDSLEIGNPEVKQPHVSSACTMSVEPSEKYDSHASSQEISKPMETESSLLNRSLHSTASTISTACDVCEPLKVESNSSSMISTPVPSLSSKIALPLPPPPPLDTSSVAGSCNTDSASTSNDNSASIQSSSDTDISHNTKATVTVIKNPSSGHVLNGLMRRWDFNFFRNRHHR